MASSKIDTRQFEHFMNKVQEYADIIVKFQGAMEDLCKKATKFAQDEYSSYGHSDIVVSYVPNGNGATIIAKGFPTTDSKGMEVGAQIAFFEFGTGEVGRGTYPDNTKLPQGGVYPTGKWEYYYDSHAKRTSNGVRGWFWDKKFRKGNEAEAEMWKTSQYIQQNARQIIQAYFKAESGG